MPPISLVCALSSFTFFMEPICSNIVGVAGQIITGPGGWPNRTVDCGPRPLKFESTRGGMTLAPHSARRVETRRAEWARLSWSAQLRRSSDSVAAPSQQRCAQHQLRRSSSSSVADATRRMSATELVCAASSQQRCAHHDRRILRRLLPARPRRLLPARRHTIKYHDQTICIKCVTFHVPALCTNERAGCDHPVRFFFLLNEWGK